VVVGHCFIFYFEVLVIAGSPLVHFFFNLFCAGLNDEGVALKVQTVVQALETNAALMQQGPLAALSAVGGLEIAAMTGAYLEASRRNIPAIVDGFISGVAALAALRHDPAVAKCLFASHKSEELGAKLLLEELGCEAVLDMRLRLGEGTGAVMALPVLRASAAIMRDMASLDDVLAAQQQ
jgi:nicotinate-nucleotide--dimethylbenzimidazole phosphoribosyltransferase